MARAYGTSQAPCVCLHGCACIPASLLLLLLHVEVLARARVDSPLPPSSRAAPGHAAPRTIEVVVHEHEHEHHDHDGMYGDRDAVVQQLTFAATSPLAWPLAAYARRDTARGADRKRVRPARAASRCSTSARPQRQRQQRQHCVAAIAPPSRTTTVAVAASTSAPGKQARSSSCDYVTVSDASHELWRLDSVARALRASPSSNDDTVGILPTDTSYAFVCNINARRAVERLYALKQHGRQRDLAQGETRAGAEDRSGSDDDDDGGGDGGGEVVEAEHEEEQVVRNGAAGRGIAAGARGTAGKSRRGGRRQRRHRAAGATADGVRGGGEGRTRKPLSLLCRDHAAIQHYAGGVDRQTFKVLRALLPGPYTFILPATREVPRVMLENRAHRKMWKRREIGVRWPADASCQAVLDALDGVALLASSVPASTSDRGRRGGADGHDEHDDGDREEEEDGEAAAADDKGIDASDRRGGRSAATRSRTRRGVRARSGNGASRHATDPRRMHDEWATRVDFVVDAGTRGGASGGASHLSTVVDVVGGWRVLRAGGGIDALLALVPDARMA